MSQNMSNIQLDDDKKNKPQWSAQIVGYNVPYWLIVVVLLIILYVLYMRGSLTGLQKQFLELTENTKRMLDRGTTSIVKPTGIAGVTTSATSPMNSEEIKQQLTYLFDQI